MKLKIYLNITILKQFFLNLSQPNVRIARENPNTCESIQADRMAIVLSGFSSHTLYTTFSTTLCEHRKIKYSLKFGIWK